MNDLKNNGNKENSFIGKIKASFSGRKFRSGAYVTLISAIVVIIVLVINLIISKIDLQVDLSNHNLYTLTDDTTQMVRNLKDDITIYYMTETGSESPVIQKIAEKYDSLSKHITVVSKDPVLYPKFAAQYVEDTITSDSFIVVNNSTGRAKYIDYSEMLIQTLNTQTYQNETTGIDVEGKITSAILYVTNPDLPVMYVVQGHGEVEIGEVFKTSMNKQNVKVETISTLTQSSIPEDCDILFFNSPTADLSDDEAAMIKDFMTTGGNAIITLDYKAEGLTNFKSLLDYYGIELVDGIIFEGDTNRHLPNTPHFLVPQILSHDITQRAIDKKVFVISAAASGLNISNTKRSSLTVDPLLATSASAYSKVNINSKTVSKEDGDINGPFYVGLLATDTYQNVTSHMAVYTSGFFFDDSAIEKYGNGDILTGTVGYLSGQATALSIPTKSLAQSRLNVTQQQGIIWGAVAIFIIPFLIIVAGIIVNLKRRKR